MSAIGSYTVLGNPPQVIFINDPVAGISYVLDPVRKRARKFTLPQRPPRPDSGQEFQRGSPDATASLLVEGEQIIRTIPAERIGNAQPIFERGSPDAKATTLSLGTKTMEGVLVEGT